MNNVKKVEWIDMKFRVEKKKAIFMILPYSAKIIKIASSLLL